MKDLLSYDYLPSIDFLIEEFKRDAENAEIRLALFERLNPVIKKSQAFRFVQMI